MKASGRSRGVTPGLGARGAEASRFAHSAGRGRPGEDGLQRNKKGIGPEKIVAIQELRRARRGNARNQLALRRLKTVQV